MNSVFTGFETNEITLAKSADVAIGKVVVLTDSTNAIMPADGEKFHGVCSAVRGDYASVVLHGCAKAFYSGTAPAVGYNKLCAGSDGTVKLDDTNGREYLVLSVDSGEQTIEFLV